MGDPKKISCVSRNRRKDNSDNIIVPNLVLSQREQIDWSLPVQLIIIMATLLGATVISIQMGLFLNWAVLSLMLRAMSRMVRPSSKENSSN